MQYATDTVVKTKHTMTTTEGVTYKFKDATVPFVYGPEPMPDGSIPVVVAEGSTEYTIGIVRVPKGLGDVVVQDWVRPMLICPTPVFDWNCPVLPVAISVSSLRDNKHVDLACKTFSCGDTSKCFRCAALKSEANTFCGESFVIKVACYTAAVLKSKANAAPSLRDNVGAFILWVDGVLSRESVVT